MPSEVKWIKIVTDIFSDEKVLIIESMPDADSIIVIWFKLLCLAGQQNNKGVFILRDKFPYTDEMFAAIFRRPINTIRMALKTFENLGMIEIINDVVMISNWEKHQTLDAYEARKEKERIRKRNARAEQRALAAGSGIHSDAQGSLPEPEPEPPQPPEPKKPKQPALPAEPAVFNLELNDGSFYGVTQSEIDQYAALYPAVDVQQEYRNMIGWIGSNPANRKTKSGIKRFINSWLSRAQNSKPASSGYPRKQAKPVYIPTPTAIPDDDDSNPFRRK